MNPPLDFTIYLELFIILHLLISERFVHSLYLDTLSTSCGHMREGRVIGGDEAEMGEFPWIASIQSLGGVHFCGGFLISKRFVISASHCFVKRYNALVDYKEDGTVNVESMKVAVNRVKLSDTSDTSKVLDVKRLILHPEFEELGLNNDIAILELKDDMTWENDMQPICLPNVQNEDESVDNVAVVAGFGYRHCKSFKPSNELHKIEVPVWKADECKKTYKDADYDFARRDFVCAGSEGKDVSKGDSGSPLMQLNTDKKWTAVGIVSSGKFMCSDLVPGVYTKVSSYLNWIKSQAQL